jgi:hypothetical protein
MDTADLTTLLADLSPADLRKRIADLDRQRSALAVLLRAASARQMGHRRPQTPIRSEEARRAD